MEACLGANVKGLVLRKSTQTQEKGDSTNSKMFHS